MTRNEPEEELPRLVGLLRDGHQAGVRLAKVPVDKGDVGAVNQVLCGLSQLFREMLSMMIVSYSASSHSGVGSRRSQRAAGCRDD